MEQRLLEDGERTRGPFPDSLTLSAAVFIAVDTSDEICDVNLGMRKCYHSPIRPTPAHRFPIPPDIFNIVVVPLAIFFYLAYI